jgi:hypothetical protein
MKAIVRFLSFDQQFQSTITEIDLINIHVLRNDDLSCDLLVPTPSTRSIN